MTTSKQTIPNGYKLTEAGVFPDDWEVKTLGQLVDYKNGKSYESFITESGDYYLITLNSLDINGKLKSDHLRVNKYDGSLGKNDIVMILSDVAHGNFLGLTDVITSDNKYVLNQRVGALNNIRLINPYLLSKYINYHQKYFKIAGQGSSQQNLSKDDILNFNVAFPKTETEQSRISSVLENIEALIDRTENLIAKKKAIKQGAMQELLTGKRRLPGFSEKWEEKKLGEIAEFYKGRGLPKSDISDDGQNKCIHYGELFTKYAEEITNILSYTDRDGDYFYSKVNDTLMPTSDVTPNGLATASCIKEDGILLGGDILVIRPYSNLDGIYLSYCIANNRDQIMQLVTGTTVFHLYASDMKKFTFKLPKLDEQQTIVKVLTEMQTEIEKLEEKLEKYNQIKQGAMQVLLTGKIRLIKN